MRNLVVSSVSATAVTAALAHFFKGYTGTATQRYLQNLNEDANPHGVAMADSYHGCIAYRHTGLGHSLVHAMSEEGVTLVKKGRLFDMTLLLGDTSYGAKCNQVLSAMLLACNTNDFDLLFDSEPTKASVLLQEFASQPAPQERRSHQLPLPEPGLSVPHGKREPVFA